MKQPWEEDWGFVEGQPSEADALELFGPDLFQMLGYVIHWTWQGHQPQPADKQAWLDSRPHGEEQQLELVGLPPADPDDHPLL